MNTGSLRWVLLALALWVPAACSGAGEGEALLGEYTDIMELDPKTAPPVRKDPVVAGLHQEVSDAIRSFDKALFRLADELGTASARRMGQYGFRVAGDFEECQERVTEAREALKSIEASYGAFAEAGDEAARRDSRRAVASGIEDLRDELTWLTEYAGKMSSVRGVPKALYWLSEAPLQRWLAGMARDMDTIDRQYSRPSWQVLKWARVDPLGTRYLPSLEAALLLAGALDPPKP